MQYEPILNPSRARYRRDPGKLFIPPLLPTLVSSPPEGPQADADAETFQCPAPAVVDGDTLRCGDRRVRLYGIDAPELPGHCRPGRACTPGNPYASTDNLRRLIGHRL
jgi:endonuclease YncB( thermonuclease family)